MLLVECWKMSYWLLDIVQLEYLYCISVIYRLWWCIVFRILQILEVQKRAKVVFELDHQC